MTKIEAEYVAKCERVLEPERSEGSLERRGSATPWEETQRLLNEAILAVNALSKHLESVPDKPRMYKANQALNVLWGIE